MTHKPVRYRDIAELDVEAAMDFYFREAGDSVTADFVARLEEVLKQIGDFPDTGSRRYENEAGVPGLRFLSLRPFPYLVFYVERETLIEIRRVLHGRRNVPGFLG